jgi:kinesin family protein 2/24
MSTPHHNSIPKIQVIVRKRPIFRKETDNGEHDILTGGQHNDLVVHEPKVKVDMTKYIDQHFFKFDHVFDQKVENLTIYKQVCKPLVQFFLAEKANATCFAYGQTGSGKTFTMMGPGGGKGEQNGLYCLAASDIFRYLKTPKFKHLSVYVSFFEIYGGKLHDLLNNRQKLVSREDGNKHIHIVGLKEVECTDVQGLSNLIGHGNSERSTGSTGANADSSRSHAIMQITAKAGDSVHGKFSFIDLAGSERAADTTNNNRRTRLEGAEINKSLLALKECIRAMDQNAHHRPFRGSKLTQVLKDSLVGNSKTVMIANVSPNSNSCENTLNTLRYADRVKELKKSVSDRANNVDAYMPHQGQNNVASSAKAHAQQHKKQMDAVRSGEKKKRQGIAVAHKPASSAPKPGGNIAVKLMEEENELMRTHTDLCSRILREEELLLEAHRDQIDSTMKLVKQEMMLLKQFDTEYNVDEYVNSLERVLATKVQAVVDLRSKLAVFKSTLEQEEKVSGSVLRLSKELRKR